MPNFNINFRKIAKENLVRDLRTPVRLTRIRAMLQPFIVIYNEFKALRDDYTYKVKFNGTVIYLETALNDRFDNTLRRIYITNNVTNPVYAYLKSELATPRYVYLKWRSTINFGTNKRCVYNNQVWVANAPALNKVPGTDPEWTLDVVNTQLFLRRKIEYTGGTGFVINVPAALVYDTAELRSLVNYWRVSGTKYSVIPF